MFSCLLTVCFYVASHPREGQSISFHAKTSKWYLYSCQALSKLMWYVPATWARFMQVTSLGNVNCPKADIYNNEVKEGTNRQKTTLLTTAHQTFPTAATIKVFVTQSSFFSQQMNQWPKTTHFLLYTKKELLLTRFYSRNWNAGEVDMVEWQYNSYIFSQTQYYHRMMKIKVQ